MYMSDRQVWISKSKKMLPVIEEAYQAFPDAANDSQALTRALFHWYYSRQENSKRGALARLEQKIDKLLALQEGDRYDHAD
jgi:hypothetical protein